VADFLGKNRRKIIKIICGRKIINPRIRQSVTLSRRLNSPGSVDYRGIVDNLRAIQSSTLY